jgi:acetyl esterase/lipase
MKLTEGALCQCGAMAVSQPGVTVGPTKVWMKMVNGAGGFGGLRGRGEWMVPEAMADDTCRILYLHGGSFMWYSGVDDIYRPLTSRIAAAAGMPVLVIDYRLSPEVRLPLSRTHAAAADRHPHRRGRHSWVAAG